MTEVGVCTSLSMARRERFLFLLVLSPVPFQDSMWSPLPEDFHNFFLSESLCDIINSYSYSFPKALNKISLPITSKCFQPQNHICGCMLNIST